MGARQKLNRLHLAGDVGLAGLVGLLAQSWAAFMVALAVLGGCDLHARHLRPRKANREARPGTAPWAGPKGGEG